jgi:diguanylate cyclase (GGDEF)-like protein
MDTPYLLLMRSPVAEMVAARPAVGQLPRPSPAKDHRMTATSSATCSPVAIGIIGLTPALAESLRASLHSTGYALGPLPAVPGEAALVTDHQSSDAVEPAVLIVLDQPDAALQVLPDGMPRVEIAPPFTPERLLAAVLGALGGARARHDAAQQMARIVALCREATALCGDLDRAPAEVATAIVALLRAGNDYADVELILGEQPAPPHTPAGLAIPLDIEGATVGHLVATPIARVGDGAAAMAQRHLLEMVAAQVAIYLARRAERDRGARLRAEDQRRVAELAAVNEVALATASLDLDLVLAELLPRTRALLGADYCSLVLRDVEGGPLTIRAADGPDTEQIVGLALPPDETFSGRIIAAKAMQRWDRDKDDPAEVAPVSALMHPGTLPHASIGAPLLVQDRAIGTIVAANHRPVTFTDAALRFLTTVAAQAAVAVENARLHADTLRLARYDSLTGLANRRYFLEQLARDVVTASRYDRPLALLIIDLDHFKDINDTFGHLAGDTLLREIANRLSTQLRRSDFPARYAGDELAIIMPETGLPGAMALAERLRAATAATPLHTGEAKLARLTLSVGVAIYTPGTTVTDFLRAADSALYFAKHEGRNRVCGPDAAQAALSGTTDDLAAILSGGNQSVIEELAAAVDARVAQSAGQAALVASVAVALGAVLGLAADELDTLRSAALVHDIGEVAIAPDILGRPGPLGARELALVRAHPRRSYDLLAAVPAFQAALPQILHHHERWDGQGYPDGLAAEAIPLGARIIAVADTWIALTTNRPHRAALSVAAALTEIEHGAGTQFDPAVVAALPEVVSRGRA